MIYLIYILNIITLYLWLYCCNIFYKLYILKLMLNKNNCIIINDNGKNNTNIINKLNNIFMKYFYNNLIFNINESNNIISNLKPEQHIL